MTSGTGRAAKYREAFGQLMQQKLDENGHKGDYTNLKIDYCLDRLDDEIKEFAHVIAKLERLASLSLTPGVDYHRERAELLEELGLEAADVANFLMFICISTGAITLYKDDETGWEDSTDAVDTIR